MYEISIHLGRRLAYGKLNALAALLAILPCFAWAADPFVGGPVQPFAQVTSWKEVRDRNVVRQHDASGTSCGPSALATLLTYGLNQPASEPELLDAVTAPLDESGRERVAAHGARIEELLRVARERGLRAQAVWLSVQDIATLRRPVIVFLRDGEQEHYSVLRGTRAENSRFALSDPSLGNIDLCAWRFGKLFAIHEDGRGIAIVVEPPAGQPWPADYALQLP